MQRPVSVLLSLLCASVSPVVATTEGRGPSPEIVAEQAPRLRSLFTIRVENRTEGAIEALTPDGERPALGHVLAPCENVNSAGYTASKWAPDSAVCGTAVNAIHIHVSNSQETGNGAVFSLIPLELAQAPANWQSFRNEEASIVTDIPAGTGIFGGWWSPFSGSSVELEGAGALPEGYVPRLGDVLLIRVEEPVPYPSCLEFENRFGGLIRLVDAEGGERVIGQVLRPVIGVGRFEGSTYAGLGRIRAAHPGVICVSTCRLGELGGFQIIPANHAMSPEMVYAREKTQWMVVGPVSALDPSWEGIAPLFRGYIRPVQGEPEGLEEYLGRFLVECRLDGGDWGPLPEASSPRDQLPEECGWALRHVTHIRILFPTRLPEMPETHDG